MKDYIDLTHQLLVPDPDNFTPPARTPWGGYEIVSKYKQHLGVNNTDIVGESWEISGHPSFPNVCQGDNIRDIGAKEPKNLYGTKNAAKHKNEMPFLVKLLNSGSWKESISEILKIHPEFKNKNYHQIHQALKGTKNPFLETLHRSMLTKNLSVQVHPKQGDFDTYPSKTEAWIILEAEAGAGIYLGLKPNITKLCFEKAMKAGQDLSEMLNFIEVSPGDIYLIPAGTLHAIGAGLVLLESQETSESTFRAYDWGRVDADNRPRQLHYNETIVATSWDDIRGKSLIKKLKKAPLVLNEKYSTCHFEKLIDQPEFQVNRMIFKNADEEYNGDTHLTEVQGLTIVDGEITIDGTSYFKGQSLILPAALGKFTIKTSKTPSVVLQTTSMK